MPRNRSRRRGPCIFLERRDDRIAELIGFGSAARRSGLEAFRNDLRADVHGLSLPEGAHCRQHGVELAIKDRVKRLIMAPHARPLVGSWRKELYLNCVGGRDYPASQFSHFA